MTDDTRAGSDAFAKVVEHYQHMPETERCLTSVGRLELARTQEIILRHLPETPGIVLDVGGGTGVYSTWLASLGHEAHLVDPVARHVEQARAHDVIASVTQGDARALPQDDRSAEVVLMLGPLYHLTEAADRIRALSEAKRVLRPGGLLFAAAVSRYASALDGLSRHLMDDPAFVEMMRADLATGVHRNITNHPEYFTTAYLHLPGELAEEVYGVGLEFFGVFGIEGPAWMYHDFEERWANPERREHMFEIARVLERAPGILGISAHLLAVAQKR